MNGNTHPTAKSELKISLEDHGEYSTELYSLTGTLLLRKEYSFGTSHLPLQVAPGNYILKITLKDGNILHRKIWVTK